MCSPSSECFSWTCNAEPDLSLRTCSAFRTVIPRKQTGDWEDLKQGKRGNQSKWAAELFVAVDTWSSALLRILRRTVLNAFWNFLPERWEWVSSSLAITSHSWRVDTGDVHVHLPGLHMHQNGWVSPQLCPTRSWKNNAGTENQSYMVQQRQGPVQMYLCAAVCCILN